MPNDGLPKIKRRPNHAVAGPADRSPGKNKAAAGTKGFPGRHVCNARSVRLFRLAFAPGGEQGRNFGADDRIVFRVFVDFQPAQIFFGYRHIREDGLDGTFGYACVAVNTAIGIDKQTIGQFVKGFDRANGGAVRVLTINAGFGNNVGHKSIEFRRPGGRSRLNEGPWAFACKMQELQT